MSAQSRVVGIATEPANAGIREVPPRDPEPPGDRLSHGGRAWSCRIHPPHHQLLVLHHHVPVVLQVSAIVVWPRSI